MKVALPAVVVNSQGAKQLRSGNPWCYRTDVESWPSGVTPGAIVEVFDSQKNCIGQAFSASKSPVAVRLLTRKSAKDEIVDEAFFMARIDRSLERRSIFAARDAYRLIHGEADLIPGLFVDRYGTALCVQTLSEGADARKLLFAQLLSKLKGVDTIVCRDDGSGRDFEGLARSKSVLLDGGHTRIRYHEGSIRFDIDLLTDSKTGSFLDQVDNHLRAGQLARGEALDTFSYHGGFALALASSCTSVLAVEQDAAAAAQARRNAEANGKANVTVEEANAFDVLRRLYDEGRQFDTIVLDPPGLAKRREGMTAARRAYHELNVRALKLLRPDGLLVTCSCSGKISRATFDEIVMKAAEDARRPMQILERRGAGVDHPVLSTLPQSEYLKAWFVRVLA